MNIYFIGIITRKSQHYRHLIILKTEKRYELYFSLTLVFFLSNSTIYLIWIALHKRQYNRVKLGMTPTSQKTNSFSNTGRLMPYSQC